MRETSTPQPHASGQQLPLAVLDVARLDAADVFQHLKSAPTGLSGNEARRRFFRVGPNELRTQKPPAWYSRLWDYCRDPLNGLLILLGIVAYITGDHRATIIIGAMLGLSIVFRLVQEERAERAVERLKAMVHTMATVVRDGRPTEIPLASVVPGDVVQLSAGNMVPADVRLTVSRDLFINQASLTGESLPVEKHAPRVEGATSGLDAANLCFMGTNVESGTATAVVITTGNQTRFGVLAASVAERQEVSSFDKGIQRFTWLMIRFIAVMVPLVFVINGFSKGNWFEALLFALAVAVGLTPELLPMIVTVNLAKGAANMAKKKVIVKRLNAMQNIGAMDILCTDKTGTLTEGKVTLIKVLDIEGRERKDILQYAYLNSSFQTGLKNLMDTAILQRTPEELRRTDAAYAKIDEIPFDFLRRRMSVVVQDPKGQHLLICKGAVEEVMAASTMVRVGEKDERLATVHHEHKDAVIEKMSAEGFRLLAVSIRRLLPEKRVYTSADESAMTLVGFLAFLDPAKLSAGDALRKLNRDGISVKVLTGDNELVTRKICGDVGLAIEYVAFGGDIETMPDDELERVAERATVFIKLEPADKVRVIKALQRRGHVVGFLGDGINDAPALKTADVGMSVDTATDIARDSSDVILLEKSLAVLHDAILGGRKVFGNIVKYIKMTASSNFGNMLSVVGASIFLPFLPMLPLQIILNNLLYDFSQITIPTDHVDPEEITKPKKWNIDSIGKYILFLGPVSSLFDYATYGLMIWVFHAWTNPSLFQTGWFVESLISQTLIIHIIRTNRLPFFRSRASKALTLATIVVIGIGVALPFTPLASALGFVALPSMYFVALLGMILVYFVLAQGVKNLFQRRFGEV